jgi:hypothetical protein
VASLSIQFRPRRGQRRCLRRRHARFRNGHRQAFLRALLALRASWPRAFASSFRPRRWLSNHFDQSPRREQEIRLRRLGRPQ